MHRPRANPFFTGLVAGVVLVVVFAVVLVSGIPGGPQIPLPWNQKMTLHVQLANADALAPHASVEIAGVKVGEVESVDAQGTLALATLQIGQQYSDIHRDATVYLRAHGLFGPKYIAIVPGTAGAPALHDGDTIGVGQTVQPVDLDAILQDLQAPEQQNLRTTIVELGEAAAGRGDDVNHLLAAANSLTQVLDSPIKAVDNVAPQLSDFLVKNEAFNNYFAQTPLDKLVANSEQTIQVFANNASHLNSLLIHADDTLAQLETALGGQPANIASIIQTLGDSKNGTITKLDRFTYLLALFGANLTGQEKNAVDASNKPTDPASQDVTSGIIGAITNVASAFYASDACGASTPASAALGDNHCSVSPDGRQHYLEVRTYNFAPSLPSLPSLPQVCLPVIIPGQPQICLPSPLAYQASPGSATNAADQWSSFGSLLAS